MNKLRDSLRVTQSVGDQVPYLNTLGPDPLFITLDDVQIMITGSTLVSAYRWRYSAKQVARKKNGDWVDVQVSVGSDVAFPDAYNGYESGNLAGAVNAIAGEDPSNLPIDFDVMPIPANVVVTAKLVPLDDAAGSIAPGDSYYWFFSLMNPMEGMCS
tara:strand:- start:785 stop:1255 length:471 start_codon:yes stop_codon:yes gene_type:complete